MSLLRRVGGGALAVAALLVVASTVGGCGGAKPAREPTAPSAALGGEAADGAELDTLVEAEAALAQHDSELDQLFPAPLATTTPSPEMPSPGAPTAPSPAPADQPTTTDRRPERATSGAAAKSSDDRCARACKAFASLSRAAEAVCRLSEDEEPCQRAQRVREENARRVAACGCK